MGMNMEQIIKKMNSGEVLAMDEASCLFEAMLSGKLTEAQIAPSLISMKLRGRYRRARRSRHGDGSAQGAVHCSERAIDTCGTGGRRQVHGQRFTAVSIILSSMGYPVVKHGNKAQSGKVGSADILEGLGFDLSYGDAGPEEFFRLNNYVFIHAQKHHPALKEIGKVRRELKVPTIFNFAGPLVNPADPEYQIIGISSRERLVFIANVLLKLGRNNVTLYSSFDGYDEVSTADRTECITVSNGTLNHFVIDPSDYFEPFDMPRVADEAQARELFLDGIFGRDEKIANLFALNTALALKTMKEASLTKGFKVAREFLASGKAGEKLEAMTSGAAQCISMK